MVGCRVTNYTGI